MFSLGVIFGEKGCHGRETPRPFAGGGVAGVLPESAALRGGARLTWKCLVSAQFLLSSSMSSDPLHSTRTPLSASAAGAHACPAGMPGGYAPRAA